MAVTLGAVKQAMTAGLIKRNSRYSIRRIIPLELQAHYGRREIVRALGTSDLKEAKRLHALVTVELNEEFARMAAKLSEAPPTPATSMPLFASMDEQEGVEEQEAYWHEQDEIRDSDPVRLRIMEAVQNALSNREREDRTILAEERAASQLAAKAKTDADDLPLADLVERWTKHQSRPTATIKSMQRVLVRFEGVVGKRTIKAVTRRDVAAFIDKMREHRSGSPCGHSISNMNAMLSMLSALFGFAVARHLIDTNPAANTQMQDPERAREKRREFDAVALKAIFESPVYRDGVRPRRGAGEAAYWVPLLALYTGARMNELCQLHPDNVLQEDYTDGNGEPQAAWVIRFEDNKARGQRVKTEGSERRVPIHPDLIGLGFVEYARRGQGSERLFPDVASKDKERISGAWGQWFSEYLRGPCAVADKRMTFHSFRHTFKHNARQVLIAPDVHNALTGHETGGAADAYGGLSYPLHPLVQAIRKYRVPGFTLPEPPRGVFADGEPKAGL